jgi:hypothetical protein
LWKPGAWTKVLAVIIGGLFAILSLTQTDGYGWAGTILMATAAITIPALQFRSLWKMAEFWVTVSLLAIAQIPLVIAVHPFADQWRAAFLLSFGIADGLCVIWLILYACANTPRPRN